ncbi:hypothetical protein Tco_0065344 [Tanacetum coccineum]
MSSSSSSTPQPHHIHPTTIVTTTSSTPLPSLQQRPTRLSLSSAKFLSLNDDGFWSLKLFYETRSTVVASHGWSFASAVPGQMTHLVAILTLDSANSYVMQGASCTQRAVSMVLFGRISPNSFLSSMLLLVGVIVVVFEIVVVGGGVSSIFKLSFVIVDSFSCYWSSACPGVLVSIVSICHVSSLCFQRHYGMIHEDGDNDTNDGHDDGRER